MAQARGVYDSDPGPRYEYTFAEALRLLRRAADEWAKGDPEDPPTEQVLKDILQLFIKQRFHRLPFGAGST